MISILGTKVNQYAKILLELYVSTFLMGVFVVFKGYPRNYWISAVFPILLVDNSPTLKGVNPNPRPGWITRLLVINYLWFYHRNSWKKPLLSGLPASREFNEANLQALVSRAAWFRPPIIPRMVGGRAIHYAIGYDNRMKMTDFVPSLWLHGKHLHLMNKTQAYYDKKFFFTSEWGLDS